MTTASFLSPIHAMTNDPWLLRLCVILAADAWLIVQAVEKGRALSDALVKYLRQV